MTKPTPGEPTPRRDFLRVLVLAPAAAAAGCATGGAASASATAAATAGATPGPTPAPARPADAAAEAEAAAALRALRDLPLAMDAEPAFVFRAAPARPGT